MVDPRETALDLNQVTLPATDLRASIEYYSRFGLVLIVDAPENRYARLELPRGGATLSLHGVDHPVQEPSPHVYFETPDPDSWIARLSAQGIDPIEPLETRAWLWREAWYEDPAGNRICIYFAGENRKDPPWRIPR